MMIALRKSTRRPLASVRCPSSRIWRRMLKTSGCAFSTSSSRTTRSSCGGRPRSAGRPRRSRRSREARRPAGDTLWRSMNSLMSILMSASSLPNMNSASAFASSVFPTPVGPRKMNEPIGRFGSLRPARARRTAFEMISIASCWPMTRLVERVLHVEQPLGLLRGDARDRDAGPHRDDLGDLLLVDGRLVAADLRLPLARGASRPSRAAVASASRRRRPPRTPGC